MNDPRPIILAGLSERSKKSARTRARMTEARKPTGPVRTEAVSFTVDGKPKGKGRARFSFKGGHAYTPASTVAYEREIKSAARIAMENHQPMDGPVGIVVMAFFQIPVSWPKYRQKAARAGEVLPTIKCDADNLLKGIMDACNRTCYGDDAQVVSAHVAKLYGDRAHVQVQIRPLNLKPAHPGEPLDASKPIRGDQEHPAHRPQDPTSLSAETT
jgi:Holliday junction resolvase RusA-like endonuclease